jgi:response regulator of citrate/malate metabolism
VKELFKKISKDKVLTKVLRFFHENPTSIDTAENIAKWIGEEKEKVKKALDFLVKVKILNRDVTYTTVGYSYTQDKELMEKIASFLEGVKNE